MKVDKAHWLRVLASDVCPLCQAFKAPQQWTCASCYRPLYVTPEHQALSDCCDAHVEAADAFFAMAKARVPA